MKKMIRSLLASSLFFALCACSSSSSANQPAGDETAPEETENAETPAEKADKGSASWETGETSIALYESENVGFFTEDEAARFLLAICPVKNTGTSPLILDTGKFEVTDKEGNAVTLDRMYSYEFLEGDETYPYPSVIYPGETGYYQAIAILPSGSPEDLQAKTEVQCRDFEEANPDYYSHYQRYDVSDVTFTEDASGAVDTLTGTVTNNTEKDTYSPEISIILFDSDNRCFYCTKKMLNEMALGDDYNLEAGESQPFTIPIELGLALGPETPKIDHYEIFVYEYNIGY